MQDESGLVAIKRPTQLWQPVGLIATGLVLYWLALPPVGWSWCGWLVFVPWTMEICRSPLEGKPVRAKLVWLLAWLFWLATLYFIPLPHPALWGAWPLLAAYMALYPLLFFVISRRLVHRLRWTPVIVLPAVWVSLEWIRNWFLTGLGMAMLSHSQYRQEWVMPMAGIGSAYLVSLWMAMVGVAIGLWFCGSASSSRIIAACGATILVLTALVLWTVQAGAPKPADNQSFIDIVLVQGSIDTEFPESYEQAREIERRQFFQYRELTIQARKQWPETRLIVWPETMFQQPLVLDDPSTNVANTEIQALIRSDNEYVRHMWQSVTGQTPLEDELTSPLDSPVAMLTGVPAERFSSGQRFNSAMLIDSAGRVEAVYHKNHRVMLGEYSPVSGLIPSLEKFIAGIDAGTEAGLLRFEGLNLMPEICFETTVPHLVRRHWLELDSKGFPPDCLVCLTNDGWFFGTSCLDLHLACNVFRAAETGTPMIVAANTGFSAEIDGRGRIVQQGPRRATGVLKVQVSPGNGSKTLWLILGDWPWKIVCLAMLAGLLGSFRNRPVSRKQERGKGE